MFDPSHIDPHDPFTTFEVIVGPLTAPLAGATIDRHLGVLADQLGGPLYALLELFATSHPVGMLAAVGYLDSVRPVELPAGPDTEELFAWGPRITGMLVGAVAADPAVPPAARRRVGAGMAAVSDRLSALGGAEVERYLHRSPTILPLLFDVIGSAYATGVVVASAADPGAAEVVPRSFAVLAAAFHALPSEDRDLLRARYASGQDLQRIARPGRRIVKRVLARLVRALRSIQARDREAARGLPS